MTCRPRDEEFFREWWASLSPHARDELAYDPRAEIPPSIYPEISRSGVPLLAQTRRDRIVTTYFLSEEVARFVERDNQRIIDRLERYAGVYGAGARRSRPSTPAGQRSPDGECSRLPPWTADLAAARRRGLLERLPSVYVDPPSWSNEMR
jgi:hypothetical protein